jgi:hypothetical protein
MRVKTKKNLKTFALVAGAIVAGVFVWTRAKNQKSGQSGWAFSELFTAKKL